MKRIGDLRKIEEMISKKKLNEINMAKELKSHFDKDPLLSIIQSIARLAIADLLKNANESELGTYLRGKKGRSLFWTAKHTNARFRGGLKPNTGIEQFKAINKGEYKERKYPTPPHKKFVATDCADVMLIYAEFVEDCGSEKNPYPNSKMKYTKTEKGWIFKDKIWSHAEWIADRRKIRGKQQIRRTKRTGLGKKLYPIKHDMVSKQKGDPPTPWQEMPEDMHPAFEAKKYVKGQDDYTQLPNETDEEYKARVIRQRKQLPAEKVRVRRKHTDSEQKHTLRLLQSLGIEIPNRDIKPGMMFWKLLDESSLMQIDRMFGLSELGADISGTTADTVGVLEALYTDLLPVDSNGNIRPRIVQRDKRGQLSPPQVTENLLLLRPLISLLPLATMVSLGHHATLECAYVLSRNNYIDYSIGYYTSLFPPDWYNITESENRLGYQLNLKKKPIGPNLYLFDDVVKSAAEAIWRTLLKWEQKKENKQMMIYYSQEGEIMEAFIIEPGEEKRFRNAATLSLNIDTYLYMFYIQKRFRNPWFPVLAKTCDKHGLIDELIG